MVRGILEDFANSEASIDLDRDSSPRLLFAIHRIAFEGVVMRWLGLMGIALFCTGCHHTANRGGPMGFGMLGSNPGNGVASAPPVYATPRSMSRFSSQRPSLPRRNKWSPRPHRNRLLCSKHPSSRNRKSCNKHPWPCNPRRTIKATPVSPLALPSVSRCVVSSGKDSFL